jgi:hypothetical protein
MVMELGPRPVIDRGGEDLLAADLTPAAEGAHAGHVAGAGPIPYVAAALAGGAQRSASEQAFDDKPKYSPRTEVRPDGSTKTTGGPSGTMTTPATTDRGKADVEHGYFHDGNYRGMPQVYTGNLKADVETSRRNAEAWARERREKQLNTIGPDGSEQSFPYSQLGKMGGAEVQYFGALHDVQSVEAKVQAMYHGRIAAYKAVTMMTAARGYEYARRHGGAAAAELTRKMYLDAGFEVSLPANLDVGPPPKKTTS